MPTDGEQSQTGAPGEEAEFRWLDPSGWPGRGLETGEGRSPESLGLAWIWRWGCVRGKED